MTATADTPATATAFDRMMAAINDPDALFTRDQTLYLLGLFTRWLGDPEVVEAAYQDGYRTRGREENGAYPPPPVYDSTAAYRWINQVDYRRACDAEARTPRDGDHLGGPVEVWGPDFCGEYDTHYRHRSMVEVKDDAGRDEEVHFTCRGRR